MIFNNLKVRAVHFAAILLAAAVLLFFGFCSRAYAASPVANTSDLEAAFENGGQYVLTADVQSDDGFTLSGGKELDIDLAGHTITTGVRPEDPYAAPISSKSNVVDGGTLILRDSIGNGQLARDGQYTNIVINNGGSLVIDGALVTGENVVSAHGSGSKVIMKSGKIDGWLGTLIKEGASMEMTGGTIDASTGISCDSGTEVSISGGTIKAELHASGNIKISGGTYRGMAMPRSGGSIEVIGGDIEALFGFYDDNATLKISGGRFTNYGNKLISGSGENQIIDIRGGYYASDPSEWLKGEYAAADSDEYDGYPYEVLKLEPPTLTAEPYSSSPYDSLILFWNDDVRGADHYSIYQYIDGEYTSVFDEATINTFRFYQMFETGKEYSFYVTAVGSNGVSESAPSNIASVAPVFTGSTELTAVNNGAGYKLGWAPVKGATGYEVWRGNGEEGTRSLIAETDAVSFTDSSASSYSIYNYIVKPKRTVGENDYYADDSNAVVTEAKPAPIVPPKKDDPSGTEFGLLQAKAIKITNTSVKIGWKKVPGAKKYVIYGNKCGTRNKYKKLTTTTKLTASYKKVAGKKIRKGTYYKFLVYAVDANGKIKSTSKTVHVATTGGKVGNDKKVTTAAKKGRVSIKKGKTFRLRAKPVPASSKLKVQRHRGMAYESTNKKIATVSSKGVIKGMGKGTCYVYAYTQNGVFAKVKVTVK